MRTQNDKAKYEINQVIHKTVRLWRGYHLSYDQLRYITKVARQELGIERPKSRRKILERLSIQEQELLIKQAYREPYPRGLILKTLLYSGARVSEFVSIRAEDLYMEEDLLYIREGKGQKSRYVPILPDLVQELLTHLAGRKRGYLFETRRHGPYSTRMIQIIVKTCAEHAGISKKVYPHLLRHTVATHLLERGMPIDQLQKFLGHERIETTRIYAETSIEAVKDGYLKAMHYKI